MIKYRIIPEFNGEQTVYSLLFEEPLGKLSVVAGLFEDFDTLIEWLEELITRNVPDSAEEGVIIYQLFLLGSIKSKIAEIIDGKFVGGVEFDTNELLKICYAWRDFLVSKR